MKVFGLFFDGVLVSHYQHYVDLELDIYHLKKNLGDNCPVLEYKSLNMGFF
jgi:hypothetical protein